MQKIALFFALFLILGQDASAKTVVTETKRVPTANLPFQFVAMIEGSVAESLYRSLGSAEVPDQGNFDKSAEKFSCTYFPSKPKKDSYLCTIRLQMNDTNGTLELLSP